MGYHECDFEVRSYEVDSLNHVNNAVYLNYLEFARTKYLNESGCVIYLNQYDILPVVIETHIKYIRELNLFDRGYIQSHWECQGEYIVVKHKIVLKDSQKKIIDAQTKMLLVSHDRIVQSIPDEVRQIIDGVKNKIEEKVL